MMCLSIGILDKSNDDVNGMTEVGSNYIFISKSEVNVIEYFINTCML